MAENRSLREVNLTLKGEPPMQQNRYQQPQMFFSKGHHEKTMLRTQFFLINRDAEPSFLFQALLRK